MDVCRKCGVEVPESRIKVHFRHCAHEGPWAIPQDKQKCRNVENAVYSYRMGTAHAMRIFAGVPTRPTQRVRSVGKVVSQSNQRVFPEQCVTTTRNSKARVATTRLRETLRRGRRALECSRDRQARQQVVLPAQRQSCVAHQDNARRHGWPRHHIMTYLCTSRVYRVVPFFPFVSSLLHRICPYLSAHTSLPHTHTPSIGKSGT